MGTDEHLYTLEPHPDEAPHVKTIFEVFLNHAGTKIIANYLNDNNVLTRHRDLWTYCAISNIITNPIYMGKIRRGGVSKLKPLKMVRLSLPWLSVAEDAITKPARPCSFR